MDVSSIPSSIATPTHQHTNGAIDLAGTDQISQTLSRRTWARGVTTIYAYTPGGELSSADYSDATPDVTRGYDRRGRLGPGNGVASK
jgi:hypothetical protein